MMKISLVFLILSLNLASVWAADCYVDESDKLVYPSNKDFAFFYTASEDDNLKNISSHLLGEVSSSSLETIKALNAFKLDFYRGDIVLFPTSLVVPAFENDLVNILPNCEMLKD